MLYWLKLSHYSLKKNINQIIITLHFASNRQFVYGTTSIERRSSLIAYTTARDVQNIWIIYGMSNIVIYDIGSHTSTTNPHFIAFHFITHHFILPLLLSYPLCQHNYSCISQVISFEMRGSKVRTSKVRDGKIWDGKVIDGNMGKVRILHHSQFDYS